VNGWFTLPDRLGARIAPLVGADASEVVVADSTSVNLFKLAGSAALGRGRRRRIVTELGNFPTDLYLINSLAALSGGTIEVVAVPREQVLDAIDGDTFLVVLTHVHYKTGEMFDMRAVTERAHAAGARILWDLSHSVGAVPLELAAHRVDFAVGCTYKYLNGGPGSPAFLYVRRDQQDGLQPVLAGWMGHKAPFEFTDDYTPGEGVSRHRCGTPAILSHAALDGALGAIEGIDMQVVREKSVRLTELFIRQVEAGSGTGLCLVSPRDPASRGSHVSFTHPRGYELMQALIAAGVIGDFRAPDVVRFGFTPLYLSYAEVWDAAERLRSLAGSALALSTPQLRATVT
jgi:kynureninase